METSEQLVRSKLTEIETKKTRDYVAANPELEKEIDGLRSGLYASIKKSMKDAYMAVAEKEKREIDNEIEELKNQKTGNAFTDSLIALKGIRKDLMDVIIECLDEGIEKKVMEDPTIKEVADAISIDVVYQSAELRYDGTLGKKDTLLVTKLTELVERKGPEYAFRNETINAVKRQVIPSLDDYRKHWEDKRKLAEASIETMCSKIGAKFNTAAGKTENEMEKSMLKTQSAVITKTWRSYLGLLAKVIDEQREQDMKEIYALDLERERVLQAAINANLTAAAAYSGK